jgi:hypothetical protein
MVQPGVAIFEKCDRSSHDRDGRRNTDEFLTGKLELSGVVARIGHLLMP